MSGIANGVTDTSFSWSLAWILVRRPKLLEANRQKAEEKLIMEQDSREQELLQQQLEAETFKSDK